MNPLLFGSALRSKRGILHAVSTGIAPVASVALAATALLFSSPTAARADATVTCTSAPITLSASISYQYSPYGILGYDKSTDPYNSNGQYTSFVSGSSASASGTYDGASGNGAVMHLNAGYGYGSAGGCYVVGTVDSNKKAFEATGGTATFHIAGGTPYGTETVTLTRRAFKQIYSYSNTASNYTVLDRAKAWDPYSEIWRKWPGYTPASSTDQLTDKQYDDTPFTVTLDANGEATFTTGMTYGTGTDNNKITGHMDLSITQNGYGAPLYFTFKTESAIIVTAKLAPHSP